MIRFLLALLLISSLAACGHSAPPVQALGAQTRLQALDSAEAREEYALRDEVRGEIRLTRWPAEGTPRAVILGVHGFGDYGPSTFERAARFWVQKGITVYTYDQRGFGRNPSLRDWPGADTLIDDLGRVAALIRAREPGLPLVLAGLSMGGGVVAAALGEGRVEADKAVLLAPALWGGPTLATHYRIAARLGAFFLPDKRWTGEGVVSIQPTDNIEMLRALAQDPYYFGTPSSREFAGLIDLMDRAWYALPQIKTPTLLIYGARDQVIPEVAIRNAFSRIKGDKKLEIMANGWHMLLRDLQAPAVYDIIADYAH